MLRALLAPRAYCGRVGTVGEFGITDGRTGRGETAEPPKTVRQVQAMTNLSYLNVRHRLSHSLGE